MGGRLEVRVPDVGEEKIVLAEILVHEGQTVAKEEELAILETEKVTFSLPAPAAGRVQEIRKKVGDRVKPGDVVLVLHHD